MPPEPWPKVSYLGSLSQPVREALLRLGKAKTFPRGRTLVRQGDPGGVLYLLLTGRVNVVVSVENGTETLIAIRHPGDVIGDMALFDNRPRFATVIARESTTTLVVSGDAFKRFIAAHPEAWTALIAVQAERVRQANIYRADAAAYEVDKQLARTVLYQVAHFATKIDGYWGADLRQAELAMLIGAKEGTVQKALRRMHEVVVSRRGKILVLNVVKLAEQAELEPPEHLLDD